MVELGAALRVHTAQYLGAESARHHLALNTTHLGSIFSRTVYRHPCASFTIRVAKPQAAVQSRCDWPIRGLTGAEWSRRQKVGFLQAARTIHRLFEQQTDDD